MHWQPAAASWFENMQGDHSAALDTAEPVTCFRGGLRPITRAGTPAAVAKLGMSAPTTASAGTTLLRPGVTPGSENAFTAISAGANPTDEDPKIQVAGNASTSTGLFEHRLILNETLTYVRITKRIC
jgi:hypothetical protein